MQKFANLIFVPVALLAALAGCEKEDVSAPLIPSAIDAVEPPILSAPKAELPFTETGEDNQPRQERELLADKSLTDDVKPSNQAREIPGGLKPLAISLSPKASNVVKRARKSMAERELLAANDLLRVALKHYPTGADRREIERNWLFSRLLLRFWQAVGDARTALRVGETLNLGGESVAVTAIEGDVLQVATSSDEVRKLPMLTAVIFPETADALAAKQLAVLGPGKYKVIAAFHLLDRDGDRDRGWELCQKMYEAGMDVDLFLPELSR